MQKGKNGITLIALIITIIIMLILLGVTSYIAINGGLFSIAKEATKSTQIESEKERLQIAVYNAYNKQGYLDLDKLNNNLPNGFSLDNKLYKSDTGNLFVLKDGKVILAKWTQDEEGNILYEGKQTSIKIGDYVDYEKYVKATTVTDEQINSLYEDLKKYSGVGNSYTSDVYPLSKEDDLKWRVLDVKEGKLRLISEKPTSSKVCLKDYNGYNNAVYLIDKVCNTLYTTDKGSALNLKIEDIEDKMNLSKWDYHDYIGETNEYTTNKYYPEMIVHEKGCWVYNKNGDGSDKLIGEEKYDKSEQDTPIKITGRQEAESKIKLTRTGWSNTMTILNWKNNIYQKIFMLEVKDDRYWLSSRSIGGYEEYASYGAFNVYESKIIRSGVSALERG